MAFSLPSPSFLLSREIDCDHMLEVLGRWFDLPTRSEAVASAHAQFAENPAIRSVTRYVMLADDSVALAEIGPRGGFRVLWSFGRA